MPQLASAQCNDIGQAVLHAIFTFKTYSLLSFSDSHILGHDKLGFSDLKNVRVTHVVGFWKNRVGTSTTGQQQQLLCRTKKQLQ